jgi:hypothetical protein
MFARSVVSLHTTHLPVQKNLASKSCVSITSKLIETKGLQVLYFGHLRKTGGRGSYRLVHAARLPFQKGLAAESSYSRTGHPIKDVHPEPAEGIFSDSSSRLTKPAKSNYSCTYRVPGGGGYTGFLVRPIRLVSKSFVSPTYAKTGGYAPCGKCRRADIFDFSPYVLMFLGRLLRQRLLCSPKLPMFLTILTEGTIPNPPSIIIVKSSM